MFNWFKKHKVPKTELDWDLFIAPNELSLPYFQGLLEKNYGYTKPKRIRSDFSFSGVPSYRWPHSSGDLTEVTRDHPNVREIEKLMDQIPGLTRMVKGVLDGIILLSGNANSGLGCSCGIYGSPPWDSKEKSNIVVMTTVDSIPGALEGIIHELGHHKIHAMGIHLTKNTYEYITNPVEDLYDSPVRYDIQRPMSACFHATFSYVYVTHLYNVLLSLEEFGGYPRFQILDRQAYNLKRIGNGINQVIDDMQVSPEGQAFKNSFLRFALRVYRIGKKLMINYKIEEEKWESKKPVYLV